MGALANILKPVVAAAFVSLFGGVTPGSAQDRLAELMTELQSAEPAAAEKLVDEIQLEWSKSGSAAADLLLSRGRKAFDAGNLDAAIEHYSALTDHAPTFAEGWVERARAYLEVGLYGPALADLETALSLNPQHFEAINGLGVILETIDKPVEAYEAYSLVRSIHPHHPAVTDALERLEPVVKGRKL